VGLARVAGLERAGGQGLVGHGDEAAQAGDPGEHLGPVSHRRERPPVELALADPELGRNAPDACRVGGEAPRRDDHQRVRRDAAARDGAGQQLQAPGWLRAGHGLLEPCDLRAPDERRGDLAVAQLGRGHAQERTCRTGTQADAGGPGPGGQIHDARAGVGADDHELAVGHPDQVDAAVRDHPLRASLRRLVLPQARHHRLEAGGRPVLAIRGSIVHERTPRGLAQAGRCRRSRRRCT
jgi:hypothetical protein